MKDSDRDFLAGNREEKRPRGQTPPRGLQNPKTVWIFSAVSLTIMLILGSIVVVRKQSSGPVNPNRLPVENVTVYDDSVLTKQAGETRAFVINALRSDDPSTWKQAIAKIDSLKSAVQVYERMANEVGLSADEVDTKIDGFGLHTVTMQRKTLCDRLSAAKP